VTAAAGAAERLAKVCRATAGRSVACLSFDSRVCLLTRLQASAKYRRLAPLECRSTCGTSSACPTARPAQAPTPARAPRRSRPRRTTKSSRTCRRARRCCRTLSSRTRRAPLDVAVLAPYQTAADLPRNRPRCEPGHSLLVAFVLHVSCGQERVLDSMHPHGADLAAWPPPVS
jgi:hypothetical protein